jgi:hypothetical protein
MSRRAKKPMPLWLICLISAAVCVALSAVNLDDDAQAPPPPVSAHHI